MSEITNNPGDQNAQPEPASAPPAAPPTGQQPQPPASPAGPLPSAANMPTPQPQGTAQPQQTPDQNPPNLRARIFDTILKAGAGTPVQGPDGRPIPMTRGIMGKAIIANALAGMMAGYGTSETVNTKNGPVRVNNPGKAVAAGFQASEKLQGQRQQAVDDAQARAYNTVKRNFDLHASMLNLQKATEEQQDKSAADGMTLYNGLKSVDEANTDPNVPKFILDTGVTGQEIQDGMKSGKYNIGRNSAIPIGWQPHIDPATGKQTVDADGIPQREPVFAVLNPDAFVHMTPELKDALKGTGPDFNRIPDNTVIKAQALLPFLMNKQNAGIVQDAINGWAKKNDELTGKKSETVDVSSLIQSNPTLRRAIPYINKYIGQDPDVMIDGLRKEKDASAQAAAGVLANALGIDEDKWKTKRDKDAADAKKTDAQLPADPARIQNAAKLIDSSTPHLNANQRANYVSRVHPGMSNDELDKTLKEASEENDTVFKQNLETKKLALDEQSKSPSAEWKPKVTADEKKKAELAENIAFNANEVSGILARRPDLIGAVAGRYTNAQQLIGNNDKDISAIGNHIHNIAMANSGVHGFRSQEGVLETEKNLLNNFKNGPDAVNGALNANVNSIQTFIDNARPEGYKTSSKQGGAGFYYKGATQALNSKVQSAPTVGDTKVWNGVNYKFDGKQWTKAQVQQ